MSGPRLALFLLGCTLAACAAVSPAASRLPTPLPPQPDCRVAHDARSLCVVVLGDSIGAGVPLEGEDRWWVRLESMLGTALPDRAVAVDSWAVPGSRVDVLEAAARDQDALESYDIAIVIEGVNDEATSSIDDWQARYSAALRVLAERGLRVIAATPPPSLEDGTFKARYDRTAVAIRKVSADAHLPVLDIAGRWRADGPSVAASYYADLLHQSAVGQELMAEMARDIVLTIVETQP